MFTNNSAEADGGVEGRGMRMECSDVHETIQLYL